MKCVSHSGNQVTLQNKLQFTVCFCCFNLFTNMKMFRFYPIHVYVKHTQCANVLHKHGLDEVTELTNLFKCIKIR